MNIHDLQANATARQQDLERSLSRRHSIATARGSADPGRLLAWAKLVTSRRVYTPAGMPSKRFDSSHQSAGSPR